MEDRPRRQDGTSRWRLDGGILAAGPGGGRSDGDGCHTDMKDAIEPEAALPTERSEGANQDVNDDVKWLRSLSPTCASCHRIRDHFGDWKDTDACPDGHVSDEHVEGAFSQGLCPDCLKTLFPEFADD